MNIAMLSTILSLLSNSQIFCFEHSTWFEKFPAGKSIH